MPFLVVPPLPNLTVEIAFDSGFATPEGDRTWTDISDYVEGASSVDITYGRADELSTPDPNTCSLTLDNRDGRFTPAKSSSPYFPDVKKGKPLRVTVTYAGVDYIRFTGYVNEWPLVWPDGSSAASTVTISASSRRARLGQTAPLTSAIRAAYLATGPEAYWPLSDDRSNRIGQTVFLDITHSLASAEATQLLAGFFTNITYAPRINQGALGPTDEGEMVVFPKAPAGAWAQYVGGGGVMKINTAGQFTAECVVRLFPTTPPAGENVWMVPFVVAANNLRQEVSVYAFDSTNTGGTRFLGIQMITRDENGSNVEEPTFFLSTSDDVYGIATDGELHHWAVACYSSVLCILYLDGVEVAFSILSTTTFDRQFDSLGIGVRMENGSMNAGHMAVTDRALRDDDFAPLSNELLAHADAATAASETPEERVIRVAGRIGVPADEIEVEDTIAGTLGSQPEASRSAAEVMDEVATSTGGVLYDTREGHLALQARNHRYNAASAFTLSAVLQEIQGDLTITDDHRYTINTVEYSRSGAQGSVPATVIDQDSIDAFGVFAQTYTVVAEADTEVEAFATDRLYRYADPDPRVSTVAVDVVNLDAPQRALVLGADIGTRFGIASLATQAPTDPMHLFLEGYSESITATSHTLSANTTPGDIYQNVFTLDDPTLGVLDAGNVIAY